MKSINCEDLSALALGASALGSGGGGNPRYDLMSTTQQLSLKGPVPLVKLEELDDDAFVVPMAFMGAPLVGMEKIPSGKELLALIEAIERDFGRKVTHLVSAEIGGGNAFTPINAASQLGLPVIDADCLGRAFPELQMCSCNLFGISASPAFLSDAHGSVVKVISESPVEMENRCRIFTMERGSSAAIALYLMSGKEAKQALIPGSVTRAIAIGKILEGDVSTLVPDLLALTGGKVLGSGTITDVDQRIENGFLSGTFTVVQEDQREIQVAYQNEYLAAFVNGAAIASTPDMIIPIEEESGLPITSDSLGFGQRVHLVALPSPPLWTTAEGLELVGPNYFGYSITYEEVKI